MMAIDPIDSPARTPSMPQRVFVYFALAITVLLILFLVIATGLRWLTQPTPSSTVVFRVDPSLAGAEITAVGQDGQPRTLDIPVPAPSALPMFLEEGAYTIKAVKNNTTVYRDEIYVAQGRRYDIDLTRPLPASGPSQNRAPSVNP